ncbi:DUF6089 family protein [Pararhodonellum marinum]|uniref:DUF6089 family protein n=1 Tax=Pararhodonellum marinum TaxID=2755358 RepID=UPI00188F02B2|nr:DUF6089 family protein [Pararhodonellum marinum]
MKKITFILFFVLLFIGEIYSQSLYRFRFEEPWSIALSAGATQYFGELYSFWKYDEGIQPDYNIQLTGRYTYGTRLKVRSDFTYYQISGQDPKADPVSYRPPRNLHFRARNFELSLINEYYLKPVKLYNLNRHFFNPYIFVGVGLSTNNPKARLRGEWVPLRPLQIEEQNYKGIVVVFPMGLGFKYKANPYMDVFLEGNYRFTLTDYLDDISAFNVSEFYENLIADYGVAGEGPNPDRLRLAIRNPDYVLENGEPNVDKILQSNGRVRRGSGLENRYDGFLTINFGVEIYLAQDVWDNWIFRNRGRSYRFW